MKEFSGCGSAGCGSASLESRRQKTNQGVFNIENIKKRRPDYKGIPDADARVSSAKEKEKTRVVLIVKTMGTSGLVMKVRAT